MPTTMYLNNLGGLNITDSPITMKEDQATGISYNYDYAKTGAITKVLASNLINTTPDTQLKTLGLGMYHNATSDLRELIRVAGVQIQKFDTSTGAITILASDNSGAGTTFPDVLSTQPAVFAPFNTVTGGTVLWMAGAGMDAIYGYTGTNITKNGASTPTGSITTVVNTAAGGTFTAAGIYYYAVQYRKLGTQAFSNVALDQIATTVNTDDTVTVSWTLTNNDTTLYDQIWVYRSAVGGSSAFTTGSLIAKLASTATSYIDTGTSIADSQNIARAGNTILDNSPLPTGTYKYITSFKRRLVTCIDSTIYISDLNKPESWPLVNTITIPSGGPITGLSVIGAPSEYTTGAEEYLCIWKERELWVITGSSVSDWALIFVDKTGCAGQSLVVSFNGFVAWLTYNGIYIWDGRGRPSRISRPINAAFDVDGDLDTSKLSQGYACQYDKGNQVIWRVSSRLKGVNRLSIKMDTRLTSLAAAENLQNPEMDGVFLFDTDTNSYYSVCSFRPSSLEEQIIAGDDTGSVYQMFVSPTNAVAFDYETKPMDMGAPNVLKYFTKVVAYVERITNNDLTLNYWADYRTRDEYKSTLKVPLSPAKGTAPGLWDIALWDQAFWDDYSPDISPIEFNLHSNENNTEGISLKLRFEQLEASVPVRIHGFAIQWQPMEDLSTPTQQV